MATADEANELYHEYKKAGYFDAFGLGEYALDLSDVTPDDQVALLEFIKGRVLARTASAPCDHYWVPQTDGNGLPDFRLYYGIERVHATCSKCNARTWFTRAEWQMIPAVQPVRSWTFPRPHWRGLPE